MPAKNAKRFFGGPGSHGPSGQAKERTRVLPVRRGFSAPGVPRRLPGRPFLCRLPLLWWILCPVPGVFSAGVSLPCSRPAAVRRFLFGLRCLLAVWPSSALFPACRQPAAFVPGPRRRGLLAICPPCALCARLFSLVFSLSCLTFASQKSFHLSLRPRRASTFFRRASTFFRKESRQRFARGRGSAPFEPPFLRPAANLFLFRAAGRLSGHSAANRRQIRETPEKPRSRAQLFGRFCAKEDACTLSPISPFISLLAGLVRPFGPQTAGWRGKRPKSQGAKLSFSSVSVRWGTGGPTLFFSNRKFGAGFCPAAGNRRWAFSPPGKTEAQRGLAPRKNRVHAQLGKGTNQVRELPGAAARLAHRRCARRRRGLFPCPGKQELSVGLHPERTACMRSWAKEQTRCATCSPQVCSAQARAFSLPGKTEAQRGLAPGKNRVRARLGKAKNRVRVLPAAGARLARRSRAGEKVLRNFAGKGLTIRTSYIIINNAPQ